MEALSLPLNKNNGSKTANGHSQNSTLEQKVADWIIDCLQTQHDPPLSKPLTIHLDTLLGMKISSKDVVAVSFEAYRALIKQMAVLGISDTMMPSLYIPLEVSETLIAGPIDAETLTRQINNHEPPSLYLTERTLETILCPLEKYVFPLSTSDFPAETENVYVRYQSTRAPEDIEKGWEYGRSIVAEYYPHAYHHRP